MGYQEDQKAVATGVTNGPELRNQVLEEVAKEFDRMTSLGDTSASFAAFVRGIKR